MQPILDYLNDGGVWTWLAFGAGALGIITAIGGLFAAYKRPAGIFAAELGLAAMLAGGVGWWQARDAADTAGRRAREALNTAPRGAHRSAAPDPDGAALVRSLDAEARRLVAIPVRVGFGMGGPAVLLGLMLIWRERR